MSTRRYSTRVCTLFLIVLSLFAIFALGSCGEDSPVAENPGNGGDDTPPPLVLPPDTAQVTVRLVAWDDLTDHGTKAEAPGDVEEILFEISAPDIQTQTRTVQASQSVIEEEFTIATGPARKISVQAFGAADTLLYSGTKYTTFADSMVTTAVGMVLATDDTPPTFAGLDAAVAISDNHILISWSVATDGSSPDREVLYLIYMSMVSGSFDYSSPSYTSTPGETSYLITDLDPGTTYYFVARAMDRAGNVDLNTSQISLATPAASGALFVDVKTGADNSSCGTSSSPCKTITYALSKTAGNQTIHVAKGTYNAATGETFPLRLKPGTTLDGEGYWWMGVKVIKETYIEGTTPTILGADNATIVSCYVKPTAWGTNSKAIDDDGHSITVYHCTIDGVLAGSLQGVGFGGGSSLIDCRVENFSSPGGRSVGVWGTGGALIKGNVVINNSHGIAVSASNTEISNCVVRNAGSIGISVGDRDFVTSDVVIFRNLVENAGNYGIGLTKCADTKIIWNTIKDPVSYGISIWNFENPSNIVEVYSNSVTGGGSLAIEVIYGQARINDNLFVCNVAGAFVRSDQVIDLRWNEWEHSPPIVSWGQGQYDPGCDGIYDICYEALYALTPAPLYQPDGGKGSCQVGIVPYPSPRK
jgi:parallel beta-helix repeat protein